MAKKKIGVTIEEGLHNATKAEAARRGVLLEEAYGQALEQWLAGTASRAGTEAITQIDTNTAKQQNAQMEKLQRLEQTKLEIIDQLGRVVTEEAGVLREIEANSRSGSRRDPTRPRTRGSG